jgi:MFS family permease
MFKRIFLQGLTAGILSAIASMIFSRIHQYVTATDFSKVVNLGTLLGINLMACLLAAIGFWILTNWLGRKGEIIFNFVFSILSFVSIIIPISAKLPLDIQFPEHFPGLTIPMHFFPALAWFTIRPIFVKDPLPVNNINKQLKKI